jgi:hypothetical protein
MGLHVEVIKSGKEDENFVYYTYQFSIPGEEYKSASGKIRYRMKVVSGRLKIDKKNGDVYTIEFAEGDNGMYAERAGWTLMKHWKLGEYPHKTLWVS